MKKLSLLLLLLCAPVACYPKRICAPACGPLEKCIPAWTECSGVFGFGGCQESTESKCGPDYKKIDKQDKRAAAPKSKPYVNEAAKPNIIVVLSDDLNFPVQNRALALGWMPNLLSQVIQQGVKFTKSYSYYSLCCPFRASFFSGLYPQNHGVWGNYPPLGGASVFNDTSTLATWLQAAGYRTGLAGKYLNNYGAGLVPPKDLCTYVPPGWTDWQAYCQPVDESQESGGMYDYRISDNGTVVQYGHTDAEYLTDVLSTRSVQFINESKAAGLPYFLLYAPLAPHYDQQADCAVNNGFLGRVHAAPRHVGSAAAEVLPQPANFNEADVSDKPAWLRNNWPSLTAANITCITTYYRDQLESMRAVDDGLGALLVAQGDLSNTYIFYLSDNGQGQGENRMVRKMAAYEWSIRIPTYVRGPGVVVNQTSAKMVGSNDWAPTIMELAQSSPGASVDGRSVAPLFTDPNSAGWTRKRLLLLARTSGPPTNSGFSGVRDETYTYVKYNPAGLPDECYNNLTDPWQMANLVSPNPCLPLMETLRASLLLCAGQTGPTGCRTLEDQ